MKYVHNKTDIPKTLHLGVVVFGSIYIEGDERSRTNPGHGYPGHSQTTLDYIVMDNEEELAKWIADQKGYGAKSYTVIRAQAKEVKEKLNIELV